MQIIAYLLKTEVGSFGLPEKEENWLPAIPFGLMPAPGSETAFLWKKDPPQTKLRQVTLPHPVELPADCWFGIESDRSVTILAASEEDKWRITRATRCIEDAQVFNEDSRREGALRSVFKLHAAAVLVGVRVPELHAELAKIRKSADEPLETTVKALVEELAKRPRPRAQ